MANDSDLEKTEQPSQRRLDQAREEGQVARSRELSTFSVLMAGGAGLWFLGQDMTRQLIKLLQDGLTLNADTVRHPEEMIQRLYDLTVQAAYALMPLLLLLLLVALFSPMLLDGWLFTLKSLQPNFSRMDPLEGIKRMFSSHGLIELGKGLAKAIVVGGAGAWAIWHHREAVLMLAGMPLNVALAQMGQLVWGAFLAIMGGMLLVVLVDVPFQLWEHNKRLMMTREEVRQEARESEGDPQVKSRIRSMQRAMARRRMMSKVATADVVVTNPTHFAVALRYQENAMRAPIVVAKGSQLVAARIRELALEHQVPILEAPPLARALYTHTELEQSIPEALYVAVAEVLAYAWQLRRHDLGGGPVPLQPARLPVPPELDPENRMSTS